MQRVNYSKKVMFLSVAISYLLGYIYILGYMNAWKTVPMVYESIFTIGFVAWIELQSYFYRKAAAANGYAFSQDKSYRFEGIFLLVCLLVVSLTNNFKIGMINDGTYGDDITAPFSRLFMHAIAIYYTLVRFNALIGSGTGRFFLFDYLNGLVILPFGNWFLRTKTVFSNLLIPIIKKEDRKFNKSKVISALIVATITVIMLNIVISILAQTDIIFSNIFDFNLNIDINISLFVNLIVSLPVGCYLFGLVYGSAQGIKKPATAYRIEKTFDKLRLVSNNMLAVALSLFTAVYIVYISLQLSYFFNAFFGELPQHLTYSEYARQGFFELCVIMAINLCLLFAVSRFASTALRQHTPLKISAMVFLVMCKFFAVNALAKLIMYIVAYGFTPLRLLSAWAIAVLMLAVVLSFITIIKPIRVVKILIFGAIGGFAVIMLV